MSQRFLEALLIIFAHLRVNECFTLVQWVSLNYEIVFNQAKNFDSVIAWLERIPDKVMEELSIKLLQAYVIKIFELKSKLFLKTALHILEALFHIVLSVVVFPVFKEDLNGRAEHILICL